MSYTLEIDFDPDVPYLLRRLGLADARDAAADFLLLLRQAQRVARPKATFTVARAIVDPLRERVRITDTASFRMVTFMSCALSHALAGCTLLWPHVATCGIELYHYGESMTSPLARYWLEEIMQHALDQAHQSIRQRIRDMKVVDKVSYLGPGSIPGWPLEQQAELFSFLEREVAFCGVALTSGLSMLPSRSISGLFFPGEKCWAACSGCAREHCPERREGHTACGGMPL